MTDAPWKTKLCIIGLLLGLGTDRARYNRASAVAFLCTFHVLNTQCVSIEQRTQGEEAAGHRGFSLSSFSFVERTCSKYALSHGSFPLCATLYIAQGSIMCSCKSF